MARITIDLPDTFPFSTRVAVAITDVNYGQHVGNHTMLAYLHEARVRFLASLGFTELDVGGCGIIMTEAALIYRSQVRYGQTLRIEVAVQDPSRVGCDIVYRVTDNENGTAVCDAKTGIAFFDYERNRVTRMPAEFARLTTV
jgi:4-hydroxybenzoyl-CoA thioesterase